MGLRMVELAFRHKLLLILPIVIGLAGGIALTWLSLEDRYVARAAIWVEKPTSFAGSSVDFNPYLSPAQNQSDAMNELLRTRNFSDRVLDRAPTLNERPPAKPLTRDELRRSTSIFTSGNHVLTITYESLSPARAVTMVQAIVDEYSAEFAGQVQKNAERAIQFYEQQRSTARTDLEEATQELNLYLSEHPDLADIRIDEAPPSTLRDPALLRLVSAVQSSSDNLDRILDKLTEAQIASTAGADNANYRVLDEPVTPDTPVRPTTRALALKPLFGLVAGVFASTAVFVVLWRLDRAVRLPGDLTFLGTQAPVMTLPALRARRRRWPPTFVRLATSISSGVAKFG